MLLLLSAPSPVFAQKGASPAEPQQAQHPGATAPTEAPAAEPADRIGRLEQQIADLQTMVAALESLVKARPDVQLPQEGAGGDAGQNFGPAAGMSARIDGLETQVGALSSQLELMTQQLRALEAKLNRGAEPQPLQPPQGEEPLQAFPQERPGRQGQLTPAVPPAAVARRDTALTTAQDQAQGGARKVHC